MKTRTYAVAEKVPADCGHLTAGRLWLGDVPDGKLARHAQRLATPRMRRRGGFAGMRTPGNDAEKERLAEVAHASVWTDGAWDGANEGVRNDWRKAVRAVVEATR